MRGRLGLLVKLFPACLAFAGPAGAQVLGGAVRDSVSGLPVPGAIVMLLDSSGATVSRNMTNERGEYRVAVRGAPRTVRFVRIGFAPRVVDFPSGAGDGARLDVEILALPSMIQPRRVLANSRCKPRKDRADALGLWEQARAGLLATIVARDENPAKMVRLGFDKIMDGNSDRVERMRVRADSVDSESVSFVAAHHAQDFVRFGFSTDSLASGTYFGPDADVLLNDAFAGAYCFELASGGRTRPGQVGLRFLPADHQRGRVDIDGTLWIDTVARELRDVEFAYLNVEAGAKRFRPGGSVSFRSMKNGVVLIDRWWIRVVSASRDSVLDTKGGLVPRDWVYAEEVGGELARATWPDGLTWRASLGALRVRAIGMDKRPAAGAVIGLLASQYYGIADANGLVEIRDLVPGPYEARIIDPRIAELGIGLPTPLRFRAARDTTSIATVIVPTTESSIADRCVASHHWEVGDSLYTMGRVVTASGKPVGDSRVNFLTRGGSGEWLLNNVYFITGTDGMFEFCHRFEPGSSREIMYRVTRNGVVLAEVVRTFTSDLNVVRIALPFP